MKDLVYYRQLIEHALQEQPDDEIPELPSDEDLDQLKLQTMKDVGKVPLWYDADLFQVDGDRKWNDVYGSIEKEYDNRRYNQYYPLLRWQASFTLKPSIVLDSALKARLGSTNLDKAEIKELLAEALTDFFKEKIHAIGIGSFNAKTGILNFYSQQVHSLIKQGLEVYQQLDLDPSLAENVDDDVPELPSDEDLDQLKLQTLVDLGKVPRWVKKLILPTKS